MSTTNTVVAVGVTPEKLANVRKWNIGLTVLHLGQAAAGTWNDNFGANPNDIVRVAGGVVTDLKRT